MTKHSLLAAVDLGSNSFRLQVARVVDDQIYPLDSLREPVRLAAGITAEKRLDEASQQRALEALKRFGERLRGLPPEAVRASRRWVSRLRWWQARKRRGSSTWGCPTVFP
jgi:exopolyphosphatase/guanosine-5'-triphosphate,3'-diphosphate pyrophosphatase